MREKNDDILVSIDCLVFNHEPYLRKCLEGIVMQKTNFKYVAIVHDDVSTDDSVSIIKEYEQKYPSIIKPIFEKENRYSKNDGSLQKIMYDAHKTVGAKYIAICEGDDYWTDQYKLQKQVDFLESHPEYSVCWHNYSRCNTLSGEIIENINKKIIRGDGCDVTEYDYLHGLCGGLPLTMMYKAFLVDPNWSLKYTYSRDTHFIYLLLQKGKGYNLNFNGAVYNEHLDSETHFRTRYEFTNLSYIIFFELYRDYPNDEVLKSYFKDVIIWNLRYSIVNHKKKEFYKKILMLFKHSPVFFIQVFVKILIVSIKTLK